MKHVVTINTENNIFVFINESIGTRNGFKHVSELLINNVWSGKATCHYINRTWERYTFESSMCQCISGLIEARAKDFKTLFMNENHYKRLTEKRKIELDKAISNDKTIMEYLHVYNDLCEKCYY